MSNDTILVIANTFGRDKWGNHFSCDYKGSTECEGFLGVMAKEGFGSPSIIP